MKNPVKSVSFEDKILATGKFYSTISISSGFWNVNVRMRSSGEKSS